MTKKLKKSGLDFGFTLVELLVVVSVIAVLASLLVANLNSARSRARDAQRKSDFDQIKKALRMYYNDYDGQNPAHADDGSGKIKGCGEFGDTDCGWNFHFGDDAADYYYMKLLPDDPQSPGQAYTYTQLSNDNYCLVATLENDADPDISKSQTRCSACTTALSLDGTSSYVACAD